MSWSKQGLFTDGKNANAMHVMLVNGILLNMVRLQQGWPPNLQDLVGSYYCYLPQQACTAPTCKLVDSYCHYTSTPHTPTCTMATIDGSWKKRSSTPDTYATISLQNDKLIFFFPFVKRNCGSKCWFFLPFAISYCLFHCKIFVVLSAKYLHHVNYNPW